MLQQSAEIEAVLGPALRESVIESTGAPPLHRTTWVCGCSVDFTDADSDEINAIDQSMRWHGCAYHRRTVRICAAP
jgi:hypothetical protein